MRTLTGLMLLSLVSGCMAWNGAKLPDMPPAPSPPRAAAPVTVDQVSSNNAHQIADALGQELQREIP